MTNWRDIVQAHHTWAHKNDEYELVMRPPASRSQILSLSERVGFPLIEEFVEFYSQIDGFGVTADGQKVSWHLMPIEQIESTMTNARDWFEETHPELAVKFFPFIDWDSGDYTGYLLAEDGSVLSSLYNFDHEDYDFDEDQVAEEIVKQGDPSIFEFLNGR